MENISEKVDYRNLLFKTIITVIITALFSFGLQNILASFEQAKIIVNNSIQTDDGFYTTISITNFKDKSSLEDMRICVSNDINISRLISKTQYSLKDNVLYIDLIQPKESISIILVTKEKIESGDVKIDSKYAISLSNFSNEKPLSTIVIVSGIVTITIYGIMFYCFGIYYEKRRKKSEAKDIKMLKETTEQINKVREETTEKINEVRKENDKIVASLNSSNELYNNSEKKRIRHKIYDLNRISDLNKELNFWRDTIRRILYSVKSEKVTDDMLFKTVTSTLKTYTVNEKSEKEIDEMLLIAEAISNKELNNDSFD